MVAVELITTNYSEIMSYVPEAVDISTEVNRKEVMLIV
jgi:hypothetical protein